MASLLFIPSRARSFILEGTANPVQPNVKRTENTMSTLAAEARGYLERRKGNREADGIGVILTKKDGAPDWVETLCMEAHKDGSTDIAGQPGQGSMLPDDWRYEFLGDVLDILEDNENLEDAQEMFREWFDGAYIMTHERTAWLASRNDRYGYVDEAREELGAGTDLMTSIWAGMFLEAQEVWASVWGSLESRLETLGQDL